jgi:NTE family protein
MLPGLLAALPLSGHSAETADPAPTIPLETAAAPRPRIGLVLSGGGARGIAHVGVLRTLERLRVPVDLVVGTSMGAVVGAAYAAGRSPEELRTFARDTDWEAVLAGRPPRSRLPLRRRTDDLMIPSRLQVGLEGLRLRLPDAAAGNQVLEATLLRLLPEGADERPGRSLPVPFNAVATDLKLGELVEMGGAPLVSAVRSSMSVPGLFAPLRVDGRLLVDGGLMRNLPVEIARAMGAEVIIAVNVGTPLSDEQKLASAFGITDQMIKILIDQNVRASLAALGPRDILITPRMDGIGFTDFAAAEDALAAGETATEGVAAALAALGVSSDAYLAHEARRVGPARATPGRDETPRLGTLEIRGTTPVAAKALATEAGLRPGDPADIEDVQAAAERLYGRGEFERVDITLRDAGLTRDVVLKPVYGAGRRSRLRFGLAFSSDFDDENEFTVSALHVFSPLNDWQGELRSFASIGSSRSLYTEWWQPLGAGSPWFGAAAIGYVSESFNLYEDGLRAARVGVSGNEAALAVGRTLGRVGEARIGVRRRELSGGLIIPEVSTFDGRVRDTTVFGELLIDTLEPLAFPTRGYLLRARREQSGDGAASTGLDQSLVQALGAFSTGDWGGHVLAEWSEGRRGIAPLELGGFLRLSGAPTESVSGNSMLFGRVVLAKRLGRLPSGLGGDVRWGFSLEAGEAFEATDSMSLSRLRFAGSSFLSIDTALGPAYLAVGRTEGYGSAVYLFLGPYW